MSSLVEMRELVSVCCGRIKVMTGKLPDKKCSVLRATTGVSPNYYDLC